VWESAPVVATVVVIVVCGWSSELILNVQKIIRVTSELVRKRVDCVVKR
jgi:putative effector of murein hydrolase LrgA (UPF0299 family)